MTELLARVDDETRNLIGLELSRGGVWHGDNQCHPCLEGSTLIKTDRGPKPIAEINRGVNVVTHKGRYRTVYDAFEQDYEGPMVVITVHNGTTIKITPEHHIYAWSERYFPARRGYPVLRRASLVKRGDYLYEVYAAGTCHLLKVKEVRSEMFKGKVYNLGVMQDESYVIHQGPALHTGSPLGLIPSGRQREKD